MSLDATTDPLARLRQLCTALPEVTEKVSHGEPTWFVRKVFVTDAYRQIAPRKLVALLG